MKIAWIGVAAAICLAACSAPKEPAALGGNAESELGGYAVGTLAPLGTFEFKTAPVYTRLAVIRHVAAGALRRREITVAQAEDVQAHADQVRSLVDASLKACNQGPSKCRGDEAAAQRLLDQAFTALAAIN